LRKAQLEPRRRALRRRVGEDRSHRSLYLVPTGDLRFQLARSVKKYSLVGDFVQFQFQLKLALLLLLFYTQGK